MLEKLRIGQKLTLAFLCMAALVCTTGVLGIMYTRTVGDAGLEIGTRLGPQTDAAMELKLSVTRAHLLLEEILSGSTDEDINEVWHYMDEASWYCNAILEGGSSSEGEYLATDDPVVRDRMQRIRTQLARLRQSAEERYSRLAAGTARAGSDSDVRFDALYEDFVRIADEAESHTQLSMNRGTRRLRSVQATSQAMLIAIMFGSVLAALAIGFGVARHLTAPVAKAAQLSDRIARGDLAVDERDTEMSARGDEIGQLLRGFVVMRESVRRSMSSIKSHAVDLAAQASQVGSTASEYSASAAEQASSVQEASTTIEEVRQLAEASVRSAREVVESAEHAVDRGHKGMEAIGEAVDTMERIGTRVDGIAKTIAELSERNERIREVVDTVNELAEQSNLLAVNASIEAAQAGEHGRGFGVVASEVRNLATQSKRAAQQIRSLLVEIERATSEAVGASQEGARRAVDGKKTIHSVREVVEELAATLEKSSDRARHIAGSAAQSAQAISQVSEALRAVSQVGQMHLQGVTNLENAATRLTELGTNMKAVTEQFRL